MTSASSGRVLMALAAALAVPALQARPQPAVGDATVVPIQVTGDPAKRFSMVVLGDGYTAAELPRFRQHVDKHLNILWSIEPFRSYRNYINVYAVEIVSGESGITCDPEVRERRNTPLGLEFGGGCTNRNARGITVGMGRQDAVRKYAAMATPAYDQILIIANTDTYGGIGGALATTSGGNSLGPLITPHELGHSLGRLGDEYTYSARGKAGGAYTGGEPSSPHMTVMSIEDMLTKQAKWFRWLGEESESGGKIERYEGGSQRTTGIWRPSKHSMMISVGYYFDQVSRERMVQRISEQVELIADSTPTDTALSPITDVIWIETPQPIYHELSVTWTVDGRPVGARPGAGALAAAPQNLRHFSLDGHGVKLGSIVTVTVVDPTPFVRDPEIRAKALTATRSWKVDDSSGYIGGGPFVFTGSTPTSRPIGARDVVAVATPYPRGRIIDIAWMLDGQPIRQADGRVVFPLGPRKLAPGRHTLTATLGEAPGPPSDQRIWTIDATDPLVSATIATPIATVTADGTPHHFIRDEFTMKLDATDDQPGYVVAEFRVNGDGWHHYYGWPDAPPGTPYKFTPRGTTIKELVYGSLSSEGLSPQPWEPREPGWGVHRIEYRGIDAAGNIGTAKAFRVTFMPSPNCTTRITSPHKGPLRVDSGITCVDGATIEGAVTVAAGASLFAREARFTGAITATGAATIEIVGGSVEGVTRLTGTTERVTIFGVTTGDVSVAGTKSVRPALIHGNTIRGALSCTGNTAAPETRATPNTIAKNATGQCAVK
jgi:hypothetical protein